SGPDMCGIAGFLGAPGTQADTDVLRRMCEEIVHRGPDEYGFFADGPLAVGMRRLSIIDLVSGSQPLYNEDRTVAVVCNGEIYNHRGLRTELEALGHRFYTHSDIECLVHLYEEHGEGF